MSHYTEGGNRGFKTSTDLSTKQFYIVKLSSGVIVLSSAATDKHLGILMDKPTAKRTGDVRLRSAAGTGCVIAGGTIAVGDALTSNASGQAIATVVAGDQVIGYALEAGVVNQIVEFLPSISKF